MAKCHGVMSMMPAKRSSTHYRASPNDNRGGVLTMIPTSHLFCRRDSTSHWLRAASDAGEYEARNVGMTTIAIRPANFFVVADHMNGLGRKGCDLSA
jgi:hypothetical protein